MAAKYELSKNDKGQFHFVLKAGNGQVILSSEHYESRAAAENGIASVQKNSGDDARFDRKESSNGKPFFNLKAANGQIIGSSQMYADEAGREGGIQSVKTNGSVTEVADLTH